MIWQDVVFTAGNVAMMIALLPSVLTKKKNVPLVTSFPTAIALSVFAATFASLGLIAAAISNGFSALFWWIFVIQNPSLYKKEF